VCKALSADDNSKQKALLDRIVAMLTTLGQRGYAVSEELGGYRVGQFDTDADADVDTDTDANTDTDTDADSGTE
jgi:glutamate synthase domain-containing protein 1